MKSKALVHIIAGPTASGKSAASLALALELGGTVINCDSKQVYDGLHILTAQPTAQEREQVPHLLYGYLPPGEICSAGKWREAAIQAIEQTLDAGRVPIICGGTGLYIKALTEGFSPIPDVPPEIRSRANTLMQELGSEGLHAQLAGRDPVMAGRIHPGHSSRIQRAWEVLEATGRSLADWQAQERITPPAHWHFEIRKILPQRDDIRPRCHARFLQMLENGALDEVSAFQKQIDSGAISSDVPLARAHGFRYLSAFLRGEISREDAIEKSVTETCQYAKRQLTWLRHQMSD